METPVATYRFQLHDQFTFANLQKVLDYLHTLGISTIYASPIFTSTSGSTHGYDVADPQAINPEIGTLEQLQEIGRFLRRHNMNWLQDIVPNHMVFGPHNHRLADVFERGPFSIYHNYFDIDWQHPHPTLTGKVMVPVLGKPLEECLKDGEIKLAIVEEGFVIQYFDNQFPLSIDAYDNILSILPDDPQATSISSLLKQLYTEAILDRSLIKWQQFKQAQFKKFTNIAFAQQVIDIINNDQLLLSELLKEQYYTLYWWRDTDSKINYRRFFAVNELIALNMQDEAVFFDYHSFIKSLYDQKLINGLRIDHIDGLGAPGTYIDRLRNLFGEDCYIVCEKILEAGEVLPAHWKLQGTTGYEFLSFANWLLTDSTGAQKLVDFYKELFPNTPEYKEVVFEKKSSFLEKHLGGEWENLVNYLYTLELQPPKLQREQIKEAIGLFMRCLPVYRLYLDGPELIDADKEILKETFATAKAKNRELAKELNFLEHLWQPDTDVTKNKKRLSFLKRLMQFTGPLTAKGVEDTTFYVYNALLSHNEVGDTPDAIGFSIQQFHHTMKARQKTYPLSLNATSTHDTKRGEDGRIRLNVLTMFADEWKEKVLKWQQLNQSVEERPRAEDEYFIYQSILAGFPADGKLTEEFITRLKEYFVKAVREGKINSNWQEPDTAYEETCGRFMEKILSKDHAFLNSFLPFFETIQEYACIFSLSQALVKITTPGIPDIYQGSELWNLSFVDPDNRRPVDYELRQQYLNELIQLQPDPVELLKHITAKRKEGVEKLYVTWKALQCRSRLAGLFTQGDYYPLTPTDECGVVAYARHYENDWAIIAAPVLNTVLVPGNNPELWSSICLSLPAGAPVNWTNEFTGETITTQKDLPVDIVFNAFPVALLTGKSL